MDYSLLLQKKNLFQKIKSNVPNAGFKNFEECFDIEYTHHSTAIEGNTLTLIETKVLLEDKISIGGKSIREIYEVVNHNKAFQYLKNCISEGAPLNEKIVKDFHSILMENILSGGIYRNVEVRITGAKHKPPVPSEMYYQIKDFYASLQNGIYNENAIELAAWTHAEFVKIHPFQDGNGRTSRLIMNYQLMANGFLPVIISKESRLEYFNALEEYAVNNNLQPFADMIAELELAQLNQYLSLSKELINEDEMEM